MTTTNTKSSPAYAPADFSECIDQRVDSLLPSLAVNQVDSLLPSLAVNQGDYPHTTYAESSEFINDDRLLESADCSDCIKDDNPYHDLYNLNNQQVHKGDLSYDVGLANDNSDSIIIDNCTVIGEKDTIRLLRENVHLFKKWTQAQQDKVSTVYALYLVYTSTNIFCRSV